MTMTIGIVSKVEDNQLYPETEYFGRNGHDVFKRLWPDGPTEHLPLGPSLELVNHSPTGFGWGYAGSGAAQLSIALLLDATSNPDTALACAYDFKMAFVAGWPFNGEWVIFRSDIINWLRQRQRVKPEKN